MCRKMLSFIISICLIMSCVFVGGVSVVQTHATSVTTTNGLARNVQDGQILQCWNWSFENIKNNIPKIAAQGFSAIQTSPIQASKESTLESWSTAGNAFWVYYQPINFSIETNSRSALGTKDDFIAMCNEAHKYGIKVIVDTVFNHLANGNTGNTLNSQTPSDIKDDSGCWHTVTNNISNYSDRYDITHNCLSGLPDLNTGSSKVQNYAISFLKECIDAGADGFRFDAAKHIETPSDYYGTSSDFWPNVLSAATSYAQSTRGITPYYYGEILDSTGGVDISAYTEYMSVTDNGGSNSIRNAINSSNSGSAANSAIFNGAQPKYTVQWNESHDTYAEDSSSYVSNTNLKKTWAIVGSRAEVCGMYLARPNSDSTKLGAADTTAWADVEVREINKFKNHFIGQSEYFASSGNIAYNERGTSGVVLVNVSGTSTSVNVPANRITSGTYTDAISGNTFTVSNGKISGNIGSTGIAVVYNKTDDGELETTEPTVAPTFEPLSGETITVTVGVIEYISETPTVHYWNNNGLTGDAVLTSTGLTASYSVGDAYWSNAEQKFNIYTAQIPVEATSMKTYTSSTNSNWSEEEVSCDSENITLVFEWSNIYHNVTAEYETETPTEEPTVEPTEQETIEPTVPPTDVNIPAGYYMVGTLSGENYWFVDESADNRKLDVTDSVSSLYTLNWTFAEGDEIKVVYFDGESITRWYNSSGSNYSIGASKATNCTLYFCPEGNDSWSYYYFTVKPVTEDETIEPTDVPTSESTENESTESETQPPTETETEVPTESETEAPTQPVKVSNIQTTVGSSTVKFTWDELDGATNYWVCVYNSTTNKWLTVTGTTSTSIVIRNLSGNTEYKYKLIARIGNSKILSLNDADVITVKTNAPLDANNISVVSNVTSADLTWDPVDGVTKYWIYKSTNADGPFYVYDGTTETSTTVKRMRPDTTYYYKIVTMTKENGLDCFSSLENAELITVKTGSAAIITTKAETNTAATATISWPAFENADQYWIMYSTTSADTNDRSHWTVWSSTTNTSYTVKFLKPNTVYYITVCARYTDSGKVATIDYIPAMVRTAYSDDEFIEFTPVSDNAVTLTWDENIDNVYKTWVCVIDEDGKEIIIDSTTTNTVTLTVKDYKNKTFALKVVDNDGRVGYLTKSGGEKYHE